MGSRRPSFFSYFFKGLYDFLDLLKMNERVCGVLYRRTKRSRRGFRRLEIRGSQSQRIGGACRRNTVDYGHAPIRTLPGPGLMLMLMHWRTGHGQAGGILRFFTFCVCAIVLCTLRVTCQRHIPHMVGGRTRRTAAKNVFGFVCSALFDRDIFTM